MRCPVVQFSAGKAAAIRRPTRPTAATRDDLTQLVDGLQVLALTRPIALVVIKKLVVGLLTDSSTPGV